MINLDFLPSRQISLYMAKLFVTRTFAVLIALVMVLMMLDLLGESGKILAVEGNSDADLWRYVRLRLPLLISQFLPFAAKMEAAGLSKMAIRVFHYYYNQLVGGATRALGVGAQLIYNRALGAPIERPKSVTTQFVKEFVKK